MKNVNVVLKPTTNDPPANVLAFTQEMSFTTIKKKYEEENCWGLLTSLDVSSCDPSLIRSAEAIKTYVEKLCDLIKMKRFKETTIVHFGEDEKVAGYSMVQLIETSLISGHFANQTDSAYIDIFSCKLYDPYEALAFTKNFFGGKDAMLHLCFRR